MLEYLPSDWRQAILVGRLLTGDGPTPVIVVDGRVRDVSRHAATVSQLINGWNGDIPSGADLGPLEINKKEKKSVGWPMYAGGIAVVAGIVVLMADNKKN